MRLQNIIMYEAITNSLSFTTDSLLRYSSETSIQAYQKVYSRLLLMKLNFKRHF